MNNDEAVIYDRNDTPEKNAVRHGVLYLVGTPIGNLSDLSPRALKILSGVDFIAAEDTRVTAKLLSFLGVRRELVSYYEHNREQRGPEIVSRLLAGESCALVTDAGMPAISDPGEELVALCAGHGIPVSAAPGPCAAVTALALSAISSRQFHFEGFLPRTNKERRERLVAIASIPETLILYEAPHRISRTLSDLLSALGDRPVSVCRELTKLNEEILRTTLAKASALYSEKEPRGEFVLVIAGRETDGSENRTNPLCELSCTEHVAHYEAQGKKRMDAVKAAAADRGMSKSEFYKLYCEARGAESGTTANTGCNKNRNGDN